MTSRPVLLGLLTVYAVVLAVLSWYLTEAIT